MDAYKVLFASGLMLTLGSFGLGLAHSRISRGRWPGASFDPLEDARASLQRGDLPAAARHYGMLARLTPGDAGVQAQLAEVLAVLGDSEGEIAACRAVARLKPGPRSQARLAQPLLRAGQAAAAGEPLRRALREQPGDGSLHNLLGLSHAGSGRLDEAIREFEEAVRLGAGRSAEANLARARNLRAGEGRR